MSERNPQNEYPYFPDYGNEYNNETHDTEYKQNETDEQQPYADDRQDEYTEQEAQYASHALTEEVGNREVEAGIPQNLSQGKSKGTKMLIIIGIGILGFGICAAGMMVLLGRANKEDVVKQPETKEMIANNKKKDFSKVELDLGASEPEPQTASDTETNSASVPDIDTGQQVSGEVDASEPQTTPYDRKMTGNVLAEDTGSGSSQASLGSTDNANSANGSISGLSPDEMAGLQAGDYSGSLNNGGNGFGNRLNPTQTASTQAMQRGDLSYLLPKGTNIACTLETKIITTLPGFTRCLVMKDVYSANGKVLLLERGSKIIGEQTSAMLQGQARVFVLWNEAETPTGIKINLTSPAAGQLGEAGIGAHVKYHFWRRFGGAIMISLIGDLGDYASNRRNSKNGDGQTFNFDNTSQSAQDMATEALKNSINIPPTGYINQGSIINIMVARDVDFSGVYQRIDTRHIPAIPTRADVKIRQ